MDPQQTNSAHPSTGAGGRLRDSWEEGSAEEERSPADAFKDVGSHFSELKEYASYYIAAKADGMKASLDGTIIGEIVQGDPAVTYL